MDSRESTSPNDRLVLLTSLSYEAKMKGTAFVFMVFISGLLLAGWPARLASNSEGPDR